MTERSSPLLGLMAILLVAGGCTGSPVVTPSQPPSPTDGGIPTGVPPVPEGTYISTITLQDAERSANGHIINLATELAGRYQLTIRGGTFRMTLDGKSAVPTPVAVRTGGEGAYARYGFWLFLGVPPIGRGTYTGDAGQIAFRSRRGACFQPGASPKLTTGLYRWSSQGGNLTLLPVDQGGITPGGSDFSSREGCLGRGFVLTAHPWTKQAGP